MIVAPSPVSNVSPDRPLTEVDQVASDAPATSIDVDDLSIDVEADAEVSGTVPEITEPTFAQASDLVDTTPLALPQTASIEGALGALGFEGVGAIRQGKTFDVTLETSDKAAAETQLNAMCDKLLANTVIEDYAVDLV